MTSIAWQKQLCCTLSNEITTELNNYNIKPSELQWINDQIKAILEDYSECSYEVFYRTHYNFCLNLRTEKRLNPTQYKDVLGFICNFLVPRLIIIEGLQHNQGTWLDNGLQPLDMYEQMMRDIMLYPRTQLGMSIKKLSSVYVEYSEYIDDIIAHINSCAFWLKRCRFLPELGPDVVNMILDEVCVL